MSITVINTDAGLSGKTIVNAEDAQTVEGLKTFDRDPNAPFAVSAGSAVVTNLDADLLDGSEGSEYVHKTDDLVFGAYTPTWTNGTLGNGSISGSYFQIGELVFYKVILTWGSTTSSSGVWSFSLPVNCNINGTMNMGMGEATDAGTGQYIVYARVGSTSTVTAWIQSQATGAMSQIATTVPFTWTTNDSFRIAGWYEAA